MIYVAMIHLMARRIEAKNIFLTRSQAPHEIMALMARYCESLGTIVA